MSFEPRKRVDRFNIECEAFIIHRDDLSVIAIGDPIKLPWRACVHCGGMMNWQWCKTRAEAEAWIEQWKKGLPPQPDATT